jgi:hypothetical protein
MAIAALLVPCALATLIGLLVLFPTGRSGTNADDAARSQWSTVGGRRRRAYALTPSGERALSSTRSSWEEFSATVTALLTGRTCAPAK